MEIRETVTVSISTDETACRLRECLCVWHSNTDKTKNPLTESNFNTLLDKLANEAFNYGREYERKLRA